MTMAVTRKWCKFFESANKNILSPNFIAAKAFRSVYNLNTGDYIHQNPIDFICVFEINNGKNPNRTNENKTETCYYNILELSVVVIDVKNQMAIGEFIIYFKIEKPPVPGATLKKGQKVNAKKKDAKIPQLPSEDILIIKDRVCSIKKAEGPGEEEKYPTFQ